MRLNETQVKQTLSQFDAQVLPDDHPAVTQLNSLFGDHTFFLDGAGLKVLEPNETGDGRADRRSDQPCGLERCDASPASGRMSLNSPAWSSCLNPSIRAMLTGGARQRRASSRR